MHMMTCVDTIGYWVWDAENEDATLLSSPPVPRPAMEEGMPEVEGPTEGIMAENRALASFDFLDEEDSDDEEEGGEWEEQTTQVRVCLSVCVCVCV